MLNQLAGAIKHTPRLFLRANVSTYVVLELTLAERGGVAGNDDELGLAHTDGLDGGLVAAKKSTISIARGVSDSRRLTRG
jgi:hypothetical protein